MKFHALALALAFLLPAGTVLADVQVLGLFRGAALLKVDGEQKLVKTGQSWKNVTLLEANSREAVAEIDGERMTLNMSTHITSNYEVPATREVRIRKNNARQYITNAEINGHRLPVLVDTGANIIAMNSETARAMGIDYESGARGQVGTASGVVSAYSVTLTSVDVGGIEVRNVQASVLAGRFPETVLLGMSYLQHVQLTERDGILSLTSKY
jgi:aspartyl protease family protein